MKRRDRYQAAIYKDHSLLLLKVHDRASGQTFWVIPGGGRESGETEEECLRREVHEETGLRIEVGSLLLDETALDDGLYERDKTYACYILEGNPQPGREGFQVHLTDPISLHLDQAKEASQGQPEHPIYSITQGDARNLHLTDGSVEMALLLGPLYHLTERVDRLAALSEAFRVLKPGGRLVAVTISRFASTLAGMVHDFLEDPAFIQIVKRDLAEGQQRNPTGKPGYFTTAFFHNPAELEAEVHEAGFQVDKILAVEGPAVFLQDLDNQWKDRRRRERILQATRWLEDKPSVLGVTGHIAAIGIRSEQRERV